MMLSNTMSSSSFVSAVDNYSEKRVGENGNYEYNWSKDTQERFVQFYFQCVRMEKDDSTKINKFMKILDEMIGELKTTHSSEPEYKVAPPLQNVPKKYFMLQNVYKLIGHTRDITQGKGEKLLSYAQILVWYNHFPELSKFAFKTLVHYVENDFSVNTSKHQFGSWSDVKYFCDFVYRQTDNQNHELINFALELMASQLQEDLFDMKQGKPISLAARWAPKERQRNFNWLFKKLAYVIYPYVNTSNNEVSFEKASRKSYRTLRTEVLSPLNKYLDTVEIKMADADGMWSKIKWNNVPSKAHAKYKKSWQNINKDGSVRYPHNEDRVACANSYKEHIEAAASGVSHAKVHGKVMNTYELVKDVFTTREPTQTDIDRINLQWSESSSRVGDCLGNIVVMADTSASMTSYNCLPFYNSLGLSIRISEKTNDTFKNRILTFSTNPKWYQFTEQHTFYDKVQLMKHHINSATTDFEKALKMVLDAVVRAELPPREISSLVLVVLSDMQINGIGCSQHSCHGYSYGQTYDDTMYDRIRKMYHAAGLQSKYGVPFEPPHIVFWNLSKTEGFPTTATTKNVTMLSGYSDALLNTFLKEGVDSLKNYNPYDMLVKLLENERYNSLKYYFKDYFYGN